MPLEFDYNRLRDLVHDNELYSKGYNQAVKNMEMQSNPALIFLKVIVMVLLFILISIGLGYLWMWIFNL